MSDVKIIDNSGKVLDELGEKMQLALEAIGMTAERYAKKELYGGHGVVTGRLRNSISHAVKDDSAYIGTNVEYAPYVELGSRGRHGYHMLGKAATEHSDEYKQIAKKIFEN